LALCAGWLALGLGGCETASNLFSPFTSTPETPVATQTAPPPVAQPAQIAIAPVIGPPENVSADLQTQLSTDLQTRSIRVAASPADKAAYTLRGYVVSSLEKKGNKAKISYIWDVTDESGKGVHRVSGEETAPAGNSKDPWSAVTPGVVKAITDKTVASIATWLPSQSAPVVATTATTGANPAPKQSASPPASSEATAQQPAPRPAPNTVTGSIDKPGVVTAVVPEVVGAPGDGSTSLRQALQRELSRSGVTLANAPSPSSYKVEGKVAMGTGANGKQPISIDWTVTDPSGKKLGTVSQKNDVPQGSLDGPWGKTADAAAAAAAQGIIKLLPQPTQTSSASN
jgi:uncharacterized lipoprotein YmbA